MEQFWAQNTPSTCLKSSRFMTSIDASRNLYRWHFTIHFDSIKIISNHFCTGERIKFPSSFEWIVHWTWHLKTARTTWKNKNWKTKSQIISRKRNKPVSSSIQSHYMFYNWNISCSSFELITRERMCYAINIINSIAYSTAKTQKKSNSCLWISRTFSAFLHLQINNVSLDPCKKSQNENELCELQSIRARRVERELEMNTLSMLDIGDCGLRIANCECELKSIKIENDDNLNRFFFLIRFSKTLIPWNTSSVASTYYINFQYFFLFHFLIFFSFIIFISRWAECSVIWHLQSVEPKFICALSAQCSIKVHPWGY